VAAQVKPGLLFEIAPIAPAEAAPRWERERVDQWGKAHLHRFGEWTVEHCGHPTALFPWSIVSPAGAFIPAPNGRAWRHLKDAKAEVERRARKAVRRGM
jgi:hypothetical protein